MDNYISIGSILFLLLWLAQEGFCSNKPLSNRVANYEIMVELNDVEKTLVANQKIKWKNTSEDTIYSIQLNLYLNAFSNNFTTFLRDRGKNEAVPNNEDCLFGFIEIDDFWDIGCKNLIDGISYIRPDDGNEYDFSLIEVVLIDPILPRQMGEWELNWRAKIPKTISRTGYSRDFFFEVQWFPKIGVYEVAPMHGRTVNGWNCHQYHSTTEYYADFGVYDVTMGVDDKFYLAATGSLIEEWASQDRKYFRYLAKDVIDFAWTASPDFLFYNDVLDCGVVLEVVYHAEHTSFVDRVAIASNFALDYMQDYVGVYPYEKLTVVLPPYHGLRSSAMEYPMLVTSFAMQGLPEGLRSTETLTIHEIVHQYFMQMVATNEQEEAWLDEGVTSYYESKIMDLYYDGFFEDDFFDINIYSKEFRRGRYFGADNLKLATLSTPTYKVKNGSHRELSYGKTAVMLWTLEGLIGEKHMRKIMRRYFDEWRFRHPNGQDFINVVMSYCNESLKKERIEVIDRLLQSCIHTTQLCDYSVASISNRIIPTFVGYLPGDGCSIGVDSSESIFESTVVFHRNEDMQLPVEIELFFESGKEQSFFWDGINPTYSIVLTGKDQIVGAKIDPEFKIYIDKNFFNNSLRINQNTENEGIKSVNFKLQSLFQRVLSIIGLLL